MDGAANVYERSAVPTVVGRRPTMMGFIDVAYIYISIPISYKTNTRDKTTFAYQGQVCPLRNDSQIHVSCPFRRPLCTIYYNKRLAANVILYELLLCECFITNFLYYYSTHT
jgi:hypothetical protein